VTLLYNYEKKQVENVPEAEVTNLVSSGVYAPRKGVRVPVVAPDGEVGSIPSENAQSAFLQGFRYHTKEEAQAKAQAGIAAAREEAFGTSTATAVAAGALRGATFGLSDVAMRAIGGEEAAEGLQATRELQPVASTVGEIGGALAGMKIPFTGGAVAKLGEKATKAVAGTERIGALASKGTAGEIAAEIMAKGAGSAIEGAFYGAGELLSEAALGDPNLTAANAAAVFGGNVILGGAIGGLVPGAITAGKKAKEKIGDILVNEMNVPAKAMDAYGKLISFLKVSDPEQQAALKSLARATPEGRAEREFLFDLVSNPNKASDYALSAVSDLAGAAKNEARVLGDVREASREVLERVKYSKGDKLSEVDNITSKLMSSIETATNKSRRYVGGAAEDLTEVLNELRTKASNAGSLADMHKAVHDARMLMDDLFEGVRKAQTPDAINTKKLITAARQEMTATLHSEKMFPGLGKNFSFADAAFSEHLTAMKEFRSAFEKKVAAKGGFAYEVGRSKAANLIKNPLSDIAIEKQAVFDRVSATVQNLASASAMMGDNPAALAAVTREVQGIQANLDKVQKARQAAILLDRLEAKTGRVLQAQVGGYVLGEVGQETGMIDMPGAGIAGFGIGTLIANPKTVMTYLMRLERGNITAAKAIEEASKKYLGVTVSPEVSGSVKSLWSGGRSMTINQLMREVQTDEQNIADDDVSMFKQHVAPYQDLAHTENMVRGMHPGLDELAPDTYSGIVNAQQRAMQFIQSKLPPDRDALFAGKTVLAQSDKIRLDRFVRASFNPGELVQEMAEGNVRPETVEAVRAVYPDFYGNIVQSLSEQLADPKVQRGVSRRKQIELAKVLGIPTSESLQNIDMLQQAWIVAPSDMQEGEAKFGQQTMSPADALQMRMAQG
jgi:hypothetical protein